MRIGEQFPELDGDDDDNSKQIMNKKGAGGGQGDGALERGGHGSGRHFD